MEIWLYICVVVSCIPTFLHFIERFVSGKQMNTQLQQREEYLKTLKKDDEVITMSGLHGKIISINNSIVELKIAKDVVVFTELESIMGKAKELLFQ